MRVSRLARRSASNSRSERGPRGGVSANARPNAANTDKTTRARRSAKALAERCVAPRIASRRIASALLILRELFQVRLLGASDEALVALGIDKRVDARIGCRPARLVLEREHGAVLRNEHVRLDAVQHAKRLRVVFRDRRHARVADQ